MEMINEDEMESFCSHRYIDERERESMGGGGASNHITKQLRKLENFT